MFGLIVSDPSHDAIRRQILSHLLHDYDLPLSCFTDAPAPLFSQNMPRAAFLRTASAALLMPGQPLPLDALLTHLSGESMPANALRKHLFLQLSLLPYLRPGREITPLEGCFLLGDKLLIVPVSPEDTVDAELPPGVWTELTGACHEGRIRCIRGYNETPVLAKANALIPIGVNDRTTSHDDADSLTLHWFQPENESECTLADGTRYHVQRIGEGITVHTETDQPFHLIVHRDGIETLVR